jgi:hypothetical protein
MTASAVQYPFHFALLVARQRADMAIADKFLDQRRLIQRPLRG